MKGHSRICRTCVKSLATSQDLGLWVKTFREAAAASPEGPGSAAEVPVIEDGDFDPVTVGMSPVHGWCYSISFNVVRIRVRMPLSFRRSAIAFFVRCPSNAHWICRRHRRCRSLRRAFYSASCVLLQATGTGRGSSSVRRISGID